MPGIIGQSRDIPEFGAPSGGRRRRLLALGLIIAVVAIEAVILLPMFSGNGLIGGDSREYDLLARNLATHHCFSYQPDCRPTMFRTPGYPGFVAAVYGLGGGVRAVRFAQFVLLALTAFLLYETVRRYFCEAAAMAAGVLCATYLPLVLSPLYQMPETLATAATVAMMWAASKLPSWKFAVIFGLLCGIAYLIRPTVVLMPVGFGLALLAARRVSIRQMTIAALACVVALSPWIGRNSAIRGRLVLVGSPPGWPVYLSALQWEGKISYRLEGATYLPLTNERNERVTARLKAGEDFESATVAVDQDYYQQGKREFAQIPWWKLVLRWPARMFHYWGPDDPGLGVAYTDLLIPAQWVALIALLLMGVWRERSRIWQQSPLWVPVIALSLFHSYFHVEPRYALMGWPSLIAYAAAGLAAVASRYEGVHSMRRGAAGSAH